jgi:hypothetical protein
LQFSKELLAAGPRFAHTATGLHERLARISGQNRDYLAHEYFNRDWNCVYFTEVVDAMAEAKLDFAGTAEPMDLVDTMNLTVQGIAFLNGIENAIQREQARDYFVNRQFRKDLFLRGVRRLSAAEQREQTLAARLVLTRPAGTIPMTVRGAQGEAVLHESIFRPLIETLAARDDAPKSFHELGLALPAISLPQLVTAGAVLVGADHAAPCQAQTDAREVRETCEALNSHLLERARTRDDINHLASPVTGSGIAVGRFQQLFLLAGRNGSDTPAEWAMFVARLLAEQGQALVKGGKPLVTREENLAELTAQASEFAEHGLPILRAVGIV